MFTFRLLALVLASLVASGCHTTKAGRRYRDNQTEQTLKRLELVAVDLGTFDIDGASSVVDGDTIRVRGLDSSLRLLAIDTEETFKKEEERRGFAAGWDVYKKQMRGSSPRPTKFPSPMGEEAKKWAQHFFEGVRQVKLERDHPGEIRDYYGRYLAYVLVEKNGKWVNFNIEATRAGMTPYFTKYGRSRRFHREFLEAQAKAREEQLGIWDPKKQHYDDYDERLAWWNAREAMIHRFEKEMEGKQDHFVITRWDALFKLEQMVGKNVVLLGAVSEIRMGDRGPTVVKLSRTRGSDFDLVFYDKDVAISSGIMQSRGEFIQVRGVVNKYPDRGRGIDRLQVAVSLPGQVIAPSEELDQLLADDWKSFPPPEEVAE